MKITLPLFFSCLLLCSNGFAAETVIITEFMASNTKTLADEDGSFEDWIEIANTGTSSVNLGGWYLTDTAASLTKWQFPATNLNAGGFLVVFASNKDRRIPGARLHTNFRLSATGEYLALVKPDGVTITSEFAPVFPPQANDVSYGIGVLTTNQALVTTNSGVRVLIPGAQDLGTNWQAINFDDSLWTLGTNGVGFGSSNTIQADYSLAVTPTAPVGYWRLNESAGTTAVNSGSGANLNGTYTSATVGTAGPRPPLLNGFEANNNAPTFNGSSGFVVVNNSLLSGRSAFTVGGWVNPAVTPGSRIGLFGQNDCVEFGFISGTTIELWTPGGGSIQVAYPFPMNTWHHVVAVANGQNLRIFLDGNLVGTGGVATANYGSSGDPFRIGGGGIQDVSGNFFNGQIDEVVVYHRALDPTEILSLYKAGTNAVGGSVVPFVKTDVGTAMSNVNSSAYIRIPFVVDNPTNISLLTLRMRYNDGFVALINGIEVARANAPLTLGQQSAATNAHSALVTEDFRFGAELQPGTNILAIQGLNVANNDPDFLIVAELSATRAVTSSSTPVYFTVPTPGSPNSGGTVVLGPAILNPANTPNVPLDSDDIVVTALVRPTFNPVGSVTLRYRVMFNAEIPVTMFDDGLHGDGLAGDGVFGAAIPASASTNGQMVRWYISATDTNGNASRWPLFFDPAGSAEYLGTVVEPSYVTSKLPIVHLFAPPTVVQPGPTTGAVGADSQGGGRVSLFFDGEFYDNIEMSLRGNSTAGYNKKSHRLKFNREHTFRHASPGGRIRDTSFTADYPDPTYMRQGLSFWLATALGCPAPFYEPYRLQLNGQFYQLANHNDVLGEELLSRIGYDPNGALYKAAGVVVTPPYSTGVMEKKTRTTEGNNDYTALATAISEALPLGQRRTNIFEMLDLPNVINYMVAARWAHENDDIWANMSLYHDNDGDNLWRIVPFDMNLSWGAIFYEGSTPLVIEGVQATNDIHKAFPMYGSSQALALSGPGAPDNFNRMYDVIFQVPQAREMFLRRMRTMLDTYIKNIGTPTNSTMVEQMILAKRDLIAEEANRDRAWWGWPAKGGQGNFDPGINITNGVSQLLSNFFIARRYHFYGKHSITNTALPVGISKDMNAGIPLAQSVDAVVVISGIEFNPSSGNQDQEYVCLTNPMPYAVDISGWKLGGGIDFTFKPGTVMPSNSVMYVSPNVVAFRARTTGPRGGQGLFVQGPYKGQLNAWGETLSLTDEIGRMVSTNGYSPAPTTLQRYLRITEIMYNPAAVAGNATDAQEFEYIELKNIGPVTLDLTGVRFTSGVDFSFTGSAVTSLAPGAKVLVVRNQAAFSARYPNATGIAGSYLGNLDNKGEMIRLEDPSGEKILEFAYDSSWYPITDGYGFSLAIVNENAYWATWGSKESWSPSGTVNGSPGQENPAPPVIAPIVINEVLSRSVPPATD
ncbi:MAG: hypothetical protein JWM16_5123, partial [Verrucomicrobiales bacterium]|nr:hypothetical protein [Verrucomicrobiales bacterium]